QPLLPECSRDGDVMQVSSPTIVPREAHADKFASLIDCYETASGIALQVARKCRWIVRVAQANSRQPLPQSECRGYVFLQHWPKREHHHNPRAWYALPHLCD